MGLNLQDNASARRGLGNEAGSVYLPALNVRTPASSDAPSTPGLGTSIVVTASRRDNESECVAPEPLFFTAVMLRGRGTR